MVFLYYKFHLSALKSGYAAIHRLMAVALPMNWAYKKGVLESTPFNDFNLF